MRISIHTLGTRGDVQPSIALALGLMARGHDVQVAGPEQFTGFAAEQGVPYFPLPGEFLALMDSPEGRAAISGGRTISAGFKLIKHVRPMMRRLLDAEWAGVEPFQPDVMIYHPKSFGVPHIGERLRRPVMLASPLPGFTATSAFPSPLLPFASLGPLNRMSHLLAIRGADMIYARTLKAWRAEVLGLPARLPGYRPVPTLYGYSRHVVPVPADWGDDVRVCGYWFLDTPDWEMPAALAAFLAAGEAPVYIGFGSMPGLDPKVFTRLIIDALALAGRRGVLATGGGALSADELPSHIYPIASAPHDQLLPHVSAIVHHGGAGTSGASLRAGLPSVIVPFFGDQPFWGRRIAALGAGPEPLDRKSLTAAQLAGAIRAALHPDMQAKAGLIGGQVRAETGVASAIGFIEDKMSGDFTAR